MANKMSNNKRLKTEEEEEEDRINNSNNNNNNNGNNNVTIGDDGGRGDEHTVEHLQHLHHLCEGELSFESNVDGCNVVFKDDAALSTISSILSQHYKEKEKEGKKNSVVVFASERGKEEISKLIVASGVVDWSDVLFFPVQVQHVPADLVRHVVSSVDSAVNGEREKVKFVISFGGGSVIGVGKAFLVKYASDHQPQVKPKFICIPTTYSGSEMTDKYGVTSNGEKIVTKDPNCKPVVVVYDVSFFHSLKPEIAFTSLFNAMAHSIEALYHTPYDFMSVMMAETSIREIYIAIQEMHANLSSVAARRRALYGSFLAGCCLQKCTMGIHHKVAHLLGGHYNANHAAIHTILLPHTMAFNDVALRNSLYRIFGNCEHSLSTISVISSSYPDYTHDSHPSRLIYRLMKDVGVATGWYQLNIKLTKEDLNKLLSIILVSPFKNPRTIDKSSVTKYLLDSYYGSLPSISSADHHHLLQLRNDQFGTIHIAKPSLVNLNQIEGFVVCLHDNYDFNNNVVANNRRICTAESVIDNARYILARTSFSKKHAFLSPQSFACEWRINNDNENDNDNLNLVLKTIEYAQKLTKNSIGIVFFGVGAGASVLLNILKQHREKITVPILAAACMFPNNDFSFPTSQSQSQHNQQNQLRQSPAIPLLLATNSVNNDWKVEREFDVDFRCYPSSSSSSSSLEIPEHAQRLVAELVKKAFFDTGIEYVKGGLNDTLRSEALPGSLPDRGMVPNRCPYNLYSEVFTATGFGSVRNSARKATFYRIRPALSQGSFQPLPKQYVADGFFVNRFDAPDGIATPEMTKWRAAIPSDLLPRGNVDFLDSINTIGGNGHPDSRSGFALHYFAFNKNMGNKLFSNSDADTLILPEHGILQIQTEWGILVVKPGEFCVIPRGGRFTVNLFQTKDTSDSKNKNSNELYDNNFGRGIICEVYNGGWSLPDRGVLGMQGLADERDFQAPTAHFEFVDGDNDEKYELINKYSGEFFKATLNHTPYDVVGWIGNVFPYKYNMDNFISVGSVTVDHMDPSVHCVVNVPFDEKRNSTMDFLCFRGRWDASEDTFRPPYYHRNAATEFNIIVDNPPSTVFCKGDYFVNPMMAAHGVSGERTETISKQIVGSQQPSRNGDSSLWIMFESCLAMRFTPWHINGNANGRKENDFRRHFSQFPVMFQQ